MQEKTPELCNRFQGFWVSKYFRGFALLLCLRHVTFPRAIVQEPETDERYQPIDNEPLKSKFVAIKPFCGVVVDNVSQNRGQNTDERDETVFHGPFQKRT